MPLLTAVHVGQDTLKPPIAPGRTSCSRNVPSAVPSLTHGSEPVAPSLAKKTSLLPSTWNPTGALSPDPGLMSLTMAGAVSAAAPPAERTCRRTTIRMRRKVFSVRGGAEVPARKGGDRRAVRETTGDRRPVAGTGPSSGQGAYSSPLAFTRGEIQGRKMRRIPRPAEPGWRRLRSYMATCGSPGCPVYEPDVGAEHGHISHLP